jgi:hypothetical protein
VGRIDNCLSSSLTVHSGVAQGCSAAPVLDVVYEEGMPASVKAQCADFGIVAGDAPLVLYAFADDQAAASPTTVGRQRILDAVK